MPEWIMGLLEPIVVGVGSLVGLALTWLFGRLAKKLGDDKATNEAIDALRAGVDVTYENYVKWAKEAATDGKLSREERRKAVAMAIDLAKGIATGPALKLLMAWGGPKLESLIQRLVGKAKNGG